MRIVIDCSKITGADSYKMCKNYGCQIAYFSKLWVPGTHEPVAKVRPSYDPSCTIFCSFNFMVIPADVILKMTITLKELKIIHNLDAL